MDLYESFKKMKDDENCNYIEKHQFSASKYAEMGLEENEIKEILKVEGCDSELSSKLAATAFNKMPENYIFIDPPKSINDVIGTIKNTIKNASKDVLDEYFEKYASKRYSGVVNRILIARDNFSETFIDEVVSEITPLVDNLIISNSAFSLTKEESSSGRKEELEQELFGVWPVCTIRSHAQKEKGDIKLAKKSKPKETTDLMF